MTDLVTVGEIAAVLRAAERGPNAAGAVAEYVNARARAAGPPIWQAEIDRLTAERDEARAEAERWQRKAELRSPDPEARPPAAASALERCERCGWPLAETREKGCVPGDCSRGPIAIVANAAVHDVSREALVASMAAAWKERDRLTAIVDDARIRLDDRREEIERLERERDEARRLRADLAEERNEHAATRDELCVALAVCREVLSVLETAQAQGGSLWGPMTGPGRAMERLRAVLEVAR